MDKYTIRIGGTDSSLEIGKEGNCHYFHSVTGPHETRIFLLTPELVEIRDYLTAVIQAEAEKD